MKGNKKDKKFAALLRSCDCSDEFSTDLGLSQWKIVS